jgi:hypothetical protein
VRQRTYTGVTCGIRGQTGGLKRTAGMEELEMPAMQYEVAAELVLTVAT